MGVRRFWAASDGSGGYDIGEGGFTVAAVCHLKFQDGAKVARAYEMAMGEAFDPRATAMLFRAAPDLAKALADLLADAVNMGLEDSPVSGSLIAAREALRKAEVL